MYTVPDHFPLRGVGVWGVYARIHQACENPLLTGVVLELGDRATRPSSPTVQATRHRSLAHRNASVASD
jgi:hypothetical protein